MTNIQVSPAPDAHAIENLLGDSRAFYRVETRAVSVSTNNDIKEAALRGEPEGLVIVADRQTEGRGRLRRPFFSPGGSGLYMSILLRPGMRASDSVLITAAAAVAVAEAIEQVSGRRAGIKWVNDIFLGGKKVCGILTEAALEPDGTMAYAALGIGVNVSAPPDGFPDGLSEIACAVFESGAPEGGRARLAAAILEGLYRYRALHERGFLAAYRERSMVLGKPILIARGDEKIPARALSIDDDCRLIVEAEGTQFPLCAGEISIRPR